MSDTEARVLGAGQKIEVNGKTYTLRPVVVRLLCELERSALHEYKRDFLESYSRNLDLLPPGDREAILRSKFEEVARWTVTELPQKTSYGVQGIPVTPELRTKLLEIYGEVPEKDNGVRAMLSLSLEAGTLKMEDAHKLTGVWPKVGKIRYDQWWVTGTISGMVEFTLSSVRREHPEMTAEMIKDWPVPKLVEASRIVESLSAADLGNM